MHVDIVVVKTSYVYDSIANHQSLFLCHRRLNCITNNPLQILCIVESTITNGLQPTTQLQVLNVATTTKTKSVTNLRNSITYDQCINTCTTRENVVSYTCYTIRDSD